MPGALRLLLLKILLLILSVSIAACAVNPVTGRQEIMFVSESKEVAMGDEAAPSLKWAFGGDFKDPELKAYLEDIVRRLWANSERSHLPLKFYVQNSSLPNAFALPGHVAITRGLLAEFENEAQFVSVMGHEIGHVTARHSAKRITQSTLLQIGIVAGGAALSGSGGGNLLTQAGAIGGALVLLKFSRSQELQADRLGARYMAELGYDPNEAVKAHQRLQAAVDKYVERTGSEKRGDSALGSILSTHPRHEVRVEEIREMIDALPPHEMKGDGKFADRFMRMTAKIRKVHADYASYDRAEKLYGDDKYEEAEAKLVGAIKLNDTEPAFFALYGMIRIQQKRYADAELYFRRSLSLDEGYQPAIFGRGVARLKLGSFWPALEDFNKSLQLYPSHAGSVFGKGVCYFKLQRYSKAVGPLSKIASAFPKQPEVHGMLGISYENLGNIQKAIEEYRLQVQVNPNNEYGLHARKRLQELTYQQPVFPYFR